MVAANPLSARLRQSTNSRLLGRGSGLPIHRFENGISAATQQRIANLLAERMGIDAIAGLAQHLRSVRIGDYSLQVHASVPHFGERSDGNLAASTEFIQQRPFRRSRLSRRRVIQKREVLTNGVVAQPDLDSQRSLPCRRTHLPYLCRQSESGYSRSCEDDRVILARLELAQSRIDIPA